VHRGRGCQAKQGRLALTVQLLYYYYGHTQALPVQQKIVNVIL
jgi:hypothetical protein